MSDGLDVGVVDESPVESKEVTRAPSRPTPSGPNLPLGESQAPIEGVQELGFLVVGEERTALMALHPMVENKMTLATPAVKKMMTAVQRAITYRRTGISFAAPSRHGKTFAIAACICLLQRHYAQLPVLMFSAKEHDVSGRRERTFHTDRLADLRHPAANSLRATTVRANLLNAIETACDHKGQRVVLAIIDEAQNHTEDEFTYHKDLTISLALRSQPIHMITCCVGQEELDYVIEDLKKKRRKDLLGRFFLEHEYLRGIASEDELKDILSQFDDAECMEYPEGTGVCYTRFFFPQAYAAGWRMEREARWFWRAIAQSAPTEDLDIGMGALVEVLKEFVFGRMHEDSPTFAGSEEMWHLALDASPFRALLNVGRR